MSANKLADAVSETECKIKHNGLDQNMEVMQHQVDMLVSAVIGVPGNPEKPGLAGTYLLLNNKIDNVTMTLGTIAETQKSVVQEQRRQMETKAEFPWLKVVSLVLAINTPIWIVLGIILKTKGVL